MQNPDQHITIKSTPSSSLPWVGTMVVLIIFCLAAIDISKPPYSNAEGAIPAIITFCTLAIIAVLYFLNSFRRTLTLNGSTLTFEQGWMFSRKAVIDLKTVTEVSGFYVSFIATFGRMYLIDVKGHSIRIDLNTFAQGDRELLIPVFTQLLQKPGLRVTGKMPGELDKTLKFWFKDKAPVTKSLTQ